MSDIHKHRKVNHDQVQWRKPCCRKTQIHSKQGVCSWLQEDSWQEISCGRAGLWCVPLLAHGCRDIQPAQEGQGSKLQQQQPLQSDLCVSWLSEVALSSLLLSSRKICNDVAYFGSSKQSPSSAAQCSWGWEQFRCELMAEGSTEGTLDCKSGLNCELGAAMAHLGLRAPARAKGTAGVPSGASGLCTEMVPEGSGGEGATSRNQEGTSIPLKSHWGLLRSVMLAHALNPKFLFLLWVWTQAFTWHPLFPHNGTIISELCDQDREQFQF